MKTNSQKPRQLESPLKPGRVTEVLLHAYNYVRGLDPDGRAVRPICYCANTKKSNKSRGDSKDATRSRSANGAKKTAPPTLRALQN